MIIINSDVDTALRRIHEMEDLDINISIYTNYIEKGKFLYVSLVDMREGLTEKEQMVVIIDRIPLDSDELVSFNINEIMCDILDMAEAYINQSKDFVVSSKDNLNSVNAWEIKWESDIDPDTLN